MVKFQGIQKGKYQRLSLELLEVYASKINYMKNVTYLLNTFKLDLLNIYLLLKLSIRIALMQKTT